ncbi:hypothetical protein QQ44_27945 [Mycolicibacterium setense]|uniref:Uncharacterized protein n=1 Tax=Mycolicibacterium setense TaxID=431269 RepID=A0ABR4YNN7_9MYCO|nr:hypothetical protein QQ44_27945 [Mycolicibacterium setense]
MKVGVRSECGGKGSAHFFAECLLQFHLHQTLQLCRCITDQLSELPEESDDRLDLVLQILQYGHHVVGDLAQDFQSFAGEDALDRVHQAAERQPVQNSTNRVLGFLDSISELLDLVRNFRGQVF